MARSSSSSIQSNSPPATTPPEPESISERIVARLRITEDGSISNKRVEQYAILRAEEVVTPYAAFLAVMARGEKRKMPSNGYQRNIHQSPAFKGRLEELSMEKAQLEETGVWGRLEWQAKQLYRKCAAMDDVGGMQRATETLLKIAQRNDKPAPGSEPAEPVGLPRGRGAPPAEVPDPTPKDDAVSDRLLNR